MSSHPVSIRSSVAQASCRRCPRRDKEEKQERQPTNCNLRQAPAKALKFLEGGVQAMNAKEMRAPLARARTHMRVLASPGKTCQGPAA